jgi:Spy/CpxP family protein refolding chaperone
MGEEHKQMFEFTYGLQLARRTALTMGMMFAGCSALWAQAGAQAAPPPGGMHQRGFGVERELRQLTLVLTLTDAQQAQVKTLLMEQRQQMEALRKPAASSDATGEAPQPSWEQMGAIRDATEAKIAAVLTDEQKPKFAAWQQQRKQMMERRRGQQGQHAPAPNAPTS